MGRDLLGVPKERTADVPEERTGDRLVTVDQLKTILKTDVASEGVSERDERIERIAEEKDESKAALPVETEEPSWIDNVQNAIPIEIVTAWAAINAVLAPEGVSISNTMFWILAGVFGVATMLHMWADVATPTKKRAQKLDVPLAYLKRTQQAQIVLAFGGFAVWAYYLIGVNRLEFVEWYDPTYSAILLPLYVVLGPQLVPDVLRKVYGVGEEDEGESDDERQSRSSPDPSR